MQVPVNEPLLNGNEKKYLNECIDTGWISSDGPFVKEFENKLSSYFTRKNAIAVSNGTVAIDIAIEALGLEEGDQVIMPTFTIISCINALLRKKCTPVFVDQENDTWNMDVSQIESKINSRTKAIMVVHIYGLPVDMDPVIRLAAKYGLKIIEDAAEVHGQEYKGRKCGSFGDISVVSFYPNKLITTGEGGMIFTDDPVLADKCRSLRNLCFIPEQRFIHYDLGFNGRMSNLQAAIGLAQYERIEETILKKRYIGEQYTSRLKHLDMISLPLPEKEFAKNIFWVYGIVLKDSYPLNANDIMKKLSQKGVGTRPFFWCLHEQPVLREMGFTFNEKFPVAENLARKGFYIPSGVALTDIQINYVSEMVQDVLNKF